MAKNNNDNGQTCGHINKQFVNTEGELEDLACSLDDGHAGDHQAEYIALREFSGVKNPSVKYKVFGGKEYMVVTEVGKWSDAAGKTSFEFATEMEQKRAELEAFKESNPGMADSHRQKARELGLIPKNRA